MDANSRTRFRVVSRYTGCVIPITSCSRGIRLTAKDECVDVTCKQTRRRRRRRTNGRERQTRVADDVKEASMVRFRGPTRVKTAVHAPWTYCEIGKDIINVHTHLCGSQSPPHCPDRLPCPRPNSRACLSSGRRVVRRRCGPKGCADGGVEDGGRKQGGRVAVEAVVCA